MENGVSGSVGGIVPAMPDQIVTRNTIEASTSMENVVNLLEKNWVYKTTLSVDSSMKSGHVFGCLRIHPSDCHEYLAHFAKAFMVWTGTMKVRVRFMANSLNGGSFRVGFVPPHFTKEQVVNTLSLSTLTAYPNMDLDPKLTDWVEFKPSEERNVLFHYMNGDQNSPSSFGGWIVFYVVGPLVSTMQAVGTVSMIVETAGAFDMRQPGPLSGKELTVGNGPLKHSLMISGASLCDSSHQVGAIQICETSVKGVPTGFTCAAAADSTLVVDSGFVSGVVPSEQSVAHEVFKGAASISSEAVPQLRLPTDQVVYCPKNLYVPTNTRELTIHHLCESDKCTTPTLKMVPTAESNGKKPRSFQLAHTSTGTKSIVAPPSPVKQGFLADSYDTSLLCKTGMNLPVLNQGESLVLFIDNEMEYMSVQTSAIATELMQKDHALDRSSCYIYNLKAAGSQHVCAQLKLNPNGTFTTSAVHKNIVIPICREKMYVLEYVTTIGVNDTFVPDSNIARRYNVQPLLASKYNISSAEAHKLLEH